MSNALKNSFIPKRSPVVITRILSRLTLESLLNLCLLWCSMPITYPSLPDDLDQSRDEYIKEIITQLQAWKETKPTKRKVIDKILVDIYPQGLNLLQYAQIDSQLIVEKQGFQIWQVSKFIDSNDDEFILNLYSPQEFLEKLVKNLSKSFMNHIYISTHPYYPLVIIRIQLFDLFHEKTSQVSNSLNSRKPFFLAFPTNSSNLLHSPLSPEDETSKFILQSISISLSTTTSQIRLQTNENLELLKNLEAAHILTGNSRFKESLGVWSCYAEGVDISPFDDVHTHKTLQKSEEEEGTRFEKIAKLRFRGGDIKSNLFQGPKKRKLEDEESKQGYFSITPIQQVEYNITKKFQSQTAKLKLKLHGNDVFGGLYELCSKGVINPEEIPGWLTGEEGYKNGEIVDGVFHECVTTNGLI